MTKTCIKCGTTKDTGEFPKDRNCCKKCKYQANKKYNAEYQKKHAEYFKEYRKKWRKENPAYQREWLEKHPEHNKTIARENREYFNQKWREWVQKNPQYYKTMDSAQKKAVHFIKKHSIHKPYCQVCGTPNVEMHHPDYGKPLEVAFVCRTCHKRIHYKSISCPQPIDLKSISS